jgi:hypothetical protein
VAGRFELVSKRKGSTYRLWPLAALQAGRRVFVVSDYKWSIAHHPLCRVFRSIEEAVAAICAMQAGERAARPVTSDPRFRPQLVCDARRTTGASPTFAMPMNATHLHVCRLDREGFNTMLRLSDSQLADVMAVGRTLYRWHRDAFLKAVAAELASKKIGHGAVHSGRS